MKTISITLTLDVAVDGAIGPNEEMLIASDFVKVITDPLPIALAEHNIYIYGFDNLNVSVNRKNT